MVLSELRSNHVILVSGILHQTSHFPSLPSLRCFFAWDSFLCENFYERLQLTPEEILGRPLATIVDPRDAYALTSTLYQVIEAGGRGGAASNGLLIQVRLVYRGIMCQASMTVVRGSHGIIVVTRLYGA